MDKKKLFFTGVGVLLLLVVVNSLKPVKLVEVHETENANFDSSNLPDELKPPSMINEGEQMPKRYLPMKNFSSILSTKPRFDT